LNQASVSSREFVIGGPVKLVGSQNHQRGAYEAGSPYLASEKPNYFQGALILPLTAVIAGDLQKDTDPLRQNIISGEVKKIF